MPEGWSRASAVEYVTVDSGACDAIVPPQVFSNTKTTKHAEYGCTYKACGGEVVTNIGQKSVNCKFNEGFSKTLDFQVGDKIIKGLLAVSKLAQSGAGVWFGPAPAYESHIVWDPEAFVAAAGPKAKIIFKNGTYHLPVTEIFKTRELNGADNDDDELYSPISVADEPAQADSVPAKGEYWPPDRVADKDPYNSPDPPPPVTLGDRDLQDNRGPDAIENTHEIYSAPDNPPVKVIRAPNQPSQEDIDKHNASGHVPFRSWCPVCVEASAKDAPHRATSGSTHDLPVFSSDYAFMGTKNQQEKITLYIVREHHSSSIFSTVIPRKGATETDVSIQFMLECIAECGYAHHAIFLKNDQEPALQAVIQGVVRRRAAPTPGRVSSVIITVQWAS